MTGENPASLAYPAAGTRRWVLAAATLGSSIVFLDNSTVDVALPALQHSLGASVVDVQWVINAYTLFLAALTPPSSLTPGQWAGLRQAVDDAFVHGFRIVMLAFAGLSMAASGVAYVSLREGTPTEPPGRDP